jgi:hypothetical protein
VHSDFPNALYRTKEGVVQSFVNYFNDRKGSYKKFYFHYFKNYIYFNYFRNTCEMKLSLLIKFQMQYKLNNYFLITGVNVFDTADDRIES